MIVEKHTDKQAVITGRIHPRAFEAARRMPGRRKWKERKLFFELSHANVEFLRDFMGNLLEWSEPMQAVLKEIEEQRRIEEQTIENKKKGVVSKEEFPFKLEPMQHQLQAFSLARGRKCFAYLMEQGTGKTKVALDDVADLYMRGAVDLLLITAPNGVHTQWVREQIPEHLPDVVPYRSFIYSSGMNKAKRQELDDILFYRDGLRAVAVNVEALSHKSGVQAVQKILGSSSKSMWIADESSRIKNHASKRTKSHLQLRDYAAYRRILSGSPITRGLEDLYSQLAFLDENILGHRSFYTFRNEYCIMGGFEGRQIVDYDNVEKLSRRLEGHSFRITKEECLDLPPVLFTKREVALTDEQRQLYKTLKEDFILAIDSGEFQAVPLAITRLMRFQQILSGHMPNMNLEQDSDCIEAEFSRVATLRPQAVLELLEETQGKTIVWTKFRMDDVILAEALRKAGVRYTRYQSDMTDDAKWEAKKEFQEDPEIKVLLSNPAVGGIGLNLTAARNCVWYSLPLDLEQYLQANERINRLGQQHAMTNTHLSTAGTVDHKLYELLQKKRFLADTVLDHDKSSRQGSKMFNDLSELRDVVAASA